jgi:hypothetical protein
MKSVANSLRRERLALDARRTPAERIVIAFQLGDADAELLATMRGIPLAAGRRVIARSRQHGRRPSGCMESLVA